MTLKQTPEHLLVQSPAPHPANTLIALFHGVGSDAQALLPLGQTLAAAFPQATIVSVNAPNASDFGRGFQWFSARDVTEDNRMPRIAQALPVFEAAVRALQARYGVVPGATVLVGFSQGGIMSLESARAGIALAARIVAIGARFAHLPESADTTPCVHLVHGDDDAVINVTHAIQAAERLQQLGAPVTLDRFAGVGHLVSQAMASRIAQRLEGAAPRA